ncbi:hypothetical protein [Streptomyces sp. NPDC090025]|uniref:hypothetical protein n=1 Tax=Streptomyces sp. NPDC090025 TaxID=3365922 RepID=UPI003832A797
MFVEVQRADTKAAALFGVAGGLFAAAVACALSNNAYRAGWPLLAPLGVTFLLLMASVLALLTALRPALGWRCDPYARREEDIDTTSVVLEWIRSLDELHQLHAEAERLVMLRSLARRKFRLIRLAVGLIMAAHGVAGSTLLITPLTL